MKKLLLPFAVLVALAIPALQSQSPAPIPAPAAGATPAAPSARQLLEQIRDANAKLLEQQAKTLQLLDEMEKTSQTIKTLGKRA
jgi:hypothetical protein